MQAISASLTALSNHMALLYRVSFLAGRPASRGLVVRMPMTSAEACLTRTLICIIAMSIFLVTPSELVNLYFYAARPTDGQLLGATIVVTNALQTTNFSFNFVLYLVVNAQFRAAVTESCRCPGLLVPCCRKPSTMTTAELLELGYPRAGVSSHRSDGSTDGRVSRGYGKRQSGGPSGTNCQHGCCGGQPR